MKVKHDRKPSHVQITTEVARYGLRRALRPFLKRRGLHFTAAVVVPDPDELVTYHEAMKRLFASEPAYDEDGDEITVVRSFKDLENAHILSSLYAMRDVRRTVILLTHDEHLPDRLLLAVDAIVSIEAPEPKHFQAAARNQGLGVLSTTEAEFLCSLRFDEIRLAARHGRPLSNALRRLKAHAAVLRSVEAPAPQPQERRTRLEDLPGYGIAREWGLELARDIKDWKEGRIEWRDVDAGALLVGPPGCGKTTYAAALAETCGLHLETASAAKWQAEGHLGDFLRAMRRSFDAAKRNAPSLLFLDEFDSFGDRASQEGNVDYRRQAINGLLEQLDGADARDGVVVLAACNERSGIDHALLRSGRIETNLEITLPDGAARVAILMHHLRQAEAFGDFPEFVSSTENFSGADIAFVARLARRAARRAERDVTRADVLNCLPERRPLTDMELYLVAIHEAGHAVVATDLKLDVIEHVQIADRVVEGRSQSLGRTRFIGQPSIGKTVVHYHNQIAMILAGVAAEEVFFGAFSDGAGSSPGGDLALATELATLAECHLGMGGTLFYEPADFRTLRSMNPLACRRVEELVDLQFDRAKAIIVKARKVVERLALELVKRKMLPGDEVRAICSGARKVSGRQNLARRGRAPASGTRP